ncbi:MAG TPA: tetratricopeptide repeat protein [Chryseosolibacter sp.]|nr:tetratricopeptide repeat protein [Chryseosolibacter sp.]
MRLCTSLLVLITVGLCSLSAQDKIAKNFEYLEEAERQIRKGDLSSAEVILSECIKHYPGFFEAYPMRGSVREQLNDLDRSLTDYSAYLEHFPQHTETLLSRGALRYKVAQYELAREDFELLLTLTATETNALFFKQKAAAANDKSPIITTSGKSHHPYVYHYLGLIEMRLNNFAKAVEHFTNAVQLNTHDADSYANRGQAKAMMSDSTAVEDYTKALQLNPEHAVAQLLMDEWESKHGNDQSAEARLTKTIALDSTLLYPYLQRGLERLENQDYTGALADFDKALSRDSDDAEIWLARGLAREKLSDLDGAYADYTKAIDLKETFAKAWVNRANVLLKKGRLADAIEDYTISLLYYPDNAVAFYNRGIAKMQSGKNIEACADFRDAVKHGMSVDEKLISQVCK